MLGSSPQGLHALLQWILRQFSDGLIISAIIIITLFIIIVIIIIEHFNKMKLSAKALQLKSPRQREAVPCFEVAGMSPEPAHGNMPCEAEGTLWVASKVAGDEDSRGTCFHNEWCHTKFSAGWT